LHPGRVTSILVLLSIGACASNTIDVTRQSSISAFGKDTPFIVLLTDEQETDPETIHCAQFLVSQLESNGLVAAPKSADARYAVMLARSQPRADAADEGGASSAADDRAGSGLGGGRGMGGGGGFGRHGGYGMGRSQSQPERGVLRIAIFDLTKPRSKQERVFYAEVHVPVDRQGSEGVVDAMITAALKNFPGKARESYSEPLPPRAAEDAG
jgi:hypothetical protein